MKLSISQKIAYLKRAQYALAGILTINLLFIAFTRTPVNGKGVVQLSKVARVMRLVRENYVDGSEEKIGYDNLVDGALEGMLQGLDQHSHYLSPKQRANSAERMKGEFGGIGITFGPRDGKYIVMEVLPDGPAAKAGLKPKDEIFRVFDTQIEDAPLMDVRGLIKGKPGTEVVLGVRRPPEDQELEITITREAIQMPTVKNAHYVEPGILYLHITQFNHKTTEELVEVLDQTRSMRVLIIDLRYNPGGLLNQAVGVCSLFLPPTLPDGTPRSVVSVVRRKPAREEYRVVDPELPKTPVPLVIMVNGQSASAAEIVAGCLKDYKRAVLVGEKTFGKGSVQDEIPLPEDRSAIRLTVAKYYTPSHTVIHGKGIEPHVTVEVPQESRIDVFQQLSRLNPGEREDDVADPELERAIELAREAIQAPRPQ